MYLGHGVEVLGEAEDGLLDPVGEGGALIHLSHKGHGLGLQQDIEDAVRTRPGSRRQTFRGELYGGGGGEEGEGRGRGNLSGDLSGEEQPKEGLGEGLLAALGLREALLALRDRQPPEADALRSQERKSAPRKSTEGAKQGGGIWCARKAPRRGRGERSRKPST